MKQPKLTLWYPASVKPVRAGVYEAKLWGFRPMRRFWNGLEWRYEDQSRGTSFGAWHNDKWRGLTQDPKAKV